MQPAFTTIRLPRRGAAALPLAALLLALAAGCSSDDDPVVVIPGDFDPEITDARATWVGETWTGLEPVGTPAVQLSWELPDAWDGEVFRVYSRRSGSGDYLLIATVTSCADRQCVYTDANVQAGRAYDYFIVSVDEATNDEIGESDVVAVTVPVEDAPPTPADLVAIPLDDAVFLQWPSVGAAKYRIFLEGVDDEVVFFEIGSTDGVGYLDTRAENGTVNVYRVAAVSEAGYVSSRSETVSAIPRPDYHAELIYASADSAQASGFRFRATGDENPIVAGSSADAQWRLEASGGDLRIVPLGSTRVTQGEFTTDLSCGPGSEPDCEHVAEAPASSDFGTVPVIVSAGNTYVFQVTAGGETHFGKIRVHGNAVDPAGRRLIVFDWAYQLVPDEPSLNLSPLPR